MCKITNRNAASGIDIRAKIEINDTFSCIVDILLNLIVTILLFAPLCNVCIYFILFLFPPFLFFCLNIVSLTVLKDNSVFY